MARKLLWPVLVIGIAMVVLPFAISLPSRASAGQSMIDQFHSMMQPASVNTTVTYFDNTFLPLRPVATGSVQAAAEVPQLGTALAGGLHMTPAQVQQFLGKNFPALSGMLATLPQMTGVFSKVSPGLDWYAPLIKTMQSNVNNYSQIASLPNFTLFTWFFVVPGALLVLISAYGLGALGALRRLTTIHPHRPAALSH